MRAAFLIVCTLLLNVQNAVAMQVLARDGAVAVSPEGADWCSPTAKIEISSPNSTLFADGNPALANVAGLVRTALSFECPAARSVDIWGKVDGKVVYRGSASSTDGWRVHSGSAASNRLALGAGGVRADENGLVPTHWNGSLANTIERVTAGRVDRSSETLAGGFYPQPDGRIRVRVGRCEGEMTPTRAGAAAPGAPTIGPQERLYAVRPASAPFKSPSNVSPLPSCNLDASWLVVRTNLDGGLHVRMTGRTLRGNSRQSFVLNRMEGDLQAVYPPQPRKISEMREYAERGDGTANAMNAVLGLFAMGLMASMMPGRGGGGGHGGEANEADTEAMREHSQRINEANQRVSSPAYQPPPPFNPSPTGW